MSTVTGENLASVGSSDTEARAIVVRMVSSRAFDVAAWNETEWYVSGGSANILNSD